MSIESLKVMIRVEGNSARTNAIIAALIYPVHMTTETVARAVTEIGS